MTNHGKSFEGDLAKTFAALRSIGVMTVEKVEPPVRVIGGGKRSRQVIFLDNPFLDFTGAWTERDGRALHFEAKHTSENSLAIGKTSGVNERQFQALKDWTNAGAVAGVIWQCPAGTFYLTAGMCASFACGRARLKPENGHILTQGKGFILFDLAPVLRSIYCR